MGRSTSNTPPEPASMEAILNYKSTLKDEDGPSMDHFHANFSEQSMERSVWNHHLSEIFVQDYVKKGLPISEVKKLPNFFMTYLETLQAANRKTTATAERVQAYKEASQRNRIEKRKKTVGPYTDTAVIYQC
jgi:hypothetical protein